MSTKPDGPRWSATTQQVPTYLAGKFPRYLTFVTRTPCTQHTPPFKKTDCIHTLLLAVVITYLDNYVGELMALLERLKIENETIVFFASDNGVSGVVSEG